MRLWSCDMQHTLDRTAMHTEFWQENINKNLKN
jgi:hypothetical protein